MHILARIALALAAICYASLARGEFTTVVNSPPATFERFQHFVSNTQINIYDGAMVPGDLTLGETWEPTDNIELNLYGGAINGALETRGNREPSTNVVVNISGGEIARHLAADAGSIVNISGGSIAQIYAGAGSQLNFLGGDFRLNGAPLSGLGAIGNTLPLNLPPGSLLTGTLADGTPLAISDQEILGDYIMDGTLTLRAANVPVAMPTTFHAGSPLLPRGIRAGQRLNVANGSAVPRNFTASWGSVVDVTDGQIGDNFEAVGAVVNITGGRLGDLATAYMGSVVNLSRGSIASNFNATRGSTVNISGGEIDLLFEALPGSTVNISGGVIQPLFWTQADSRVTVVGSGFRVNGVPVSGLSNVGATRQLNLPTGAVLSGTLADGRTFAFSDQVYDVFAAGTLTLQSAAAPASGPAVIRVPADPAPTGLRASQALFLADGGALGNDFTADWGSVVNIDGGEVGAGFEAVGSLVSITGGAVGGRFDVFYGSALNVSGGSLEGLVRAHNGSVVNIAGGHVGHYLTADRGGVVNISAGTVDGYAQVHQGGVLNISGGQVGDELRNYGGVLNLTGGSIGNDAGFYGNSTANVSGGAIGDRFQVDRESRLLITGDDFRLNGEPISGIPDYGLSVPVDIPAGSVFSGTLSDGTPFAFSDEDGDRLEAGSVRVLKTYFTPPDPPMIDLPTGPAPAGLQGGHALVVDATHTLGDHFVAGWGSTLTIAGGHVGANFEAVGAQVMIAAGTVGDHFDAFYGSTVTISGGTVGRHFEAHSGSIVNLTGGTILEDFVALPGSVVNISGGELRPFGVSANSILNISGGIVSDFHVFAPGSEVHVIGAGFLMDGQPIPGLSAGNTVELIGDNYARITGWLTDGNPISLLLFDDLYDEDSRPARVTLTSVATADFNGDGSVDADDLASWATTYCHPTVTDADHDGDADGTDFLAWQRQLGSLTTASTRATVPEPAAPQLFLLMATGVFFRNRANGPNRALAPLYRESPCRG